jgi:DNA-directed RNA polymerase specialized sigma24 family protein
MYAMKEDRSLKNGDSLERLEEAYRSEKPRFLARLRAAGRTLEEAEDLVHDVYAETMERLHLVADIANLPAWIPRTASSGTVSRKPWTTPCGPCRLPRGGWWRRRCSAA